MVNIAGLGGMAGGGVTVVITAVDRFSKTFTRAQTGVASLGKAIGTIAIGAGIAMAVLGVSAVKTAASFETAFTGVRKTVELTEAEFEELEQRFRDLTTITPITFEELSRIGEIAGQLGVEGVDDIEKFTRTIADISVTTDLTAEMAATSFARIANVMQIPLNQVDRMGAVVVDLGNNFATTEPEIANFAQRISGAGAIAGFTTDEIFAIGAALTSVGIKAEAGGTAVQKSLLFMNNAATGVQMTFEEFAKISELTGEELDLAFTKSKGHLELFAKTAGLTSVEFQDLWREDASKAFEQFVLGLKEEGDNAFNVLDTLGLGGARTARAFLSLAEAGDLITRTFETASVAWEENTALVEEAEKRYKTFESQISMVKNEFRLMMADLGEQLMPIILEGVVPAIKNDLIPALKDILPVIGTILTVFIQSIGVIIKAWMILADSIAAVIAAMVLATIGGVELIVNSVIFAINALITQLNRLPFVNIGPIGYVSWTEKPQARFVNILDKLEEDWTDLFKIIENIGVTIGGAANVKAVENEELRTFYETTTPNTNTFNIENLYASDSQSVMDAGQEALLNKTSI